jgi:hypothetical protein
MAAQSGFAQIAPNFGQRSQDSVGVSTSVQTQPILENPAPGRPARSPILLLNRSPPTTTPLNLSSDFTPTKELGSTARKRLPHSNNASFATRMSALGSMGSVTRLDERGIDGAAYSHPSQSFFE